MLVLFYVWFCMDFMFLAARSSRKDVCPYMFFEVEPFFRDDGTNHTFRGGRVLRKVPRVRQGSVTAHEPFTSPLDPKNNVLTEI